MLSIEPVFMDRAGFRGQGRFSWIGPVEPVWVDD
jgi:hypothetical protein